MSARSINGSLNPDQRMTAERHESKFRIDGGRIDQLVAELNRRLPRHRFTGEGANALPDPQSFVTSVYFDTPSRTLFRAAVADAAHNIKLRVREYYDLHPSLVELATDPSQIVRYQPWLWFELKARDGERTTKRRLRLLKRDMPRFLAAISGAGPETTALDLNSATDHPGEDDDTIKVITGICRDLAEPLSASCLVNYRRLSWQGADGELRITLDRSLAFFAPPADLWTREKTLLRSTLGSLRGAEAGALLEVKHRSALPAWIGETTAQLGSSAVPFSKFAAASRATGGTP